MADLPEEDLSVIERQAFNLAQAGIQLDQARLGGDDNGTLAQALEHNLQVWVEIGILIKSPESQLEENVRDNDDPECIIETMSDKRLTRKQNQNERKFERRNL